MGWFDKREENVQGDQQAVDRYRYMLRTAPPETIEQAHEEAFAQLSPEQRRMVLDQLTASVPSEESRRATDDPASLARLATRTEMRQPGMLERAFGSARGGAGMGGLGGIFAGSLLGTIAGSFIGSSIAHSFFDQHPFDASAQDSSGPDDSNWDTQEAGADDVGGDFGDIDI